MSVFRELLPPGLFGDIPFDASAPEPIPEESQTIWQIIGANLTRSVIRYISIPGTHLTYPETRQKGVIFVAHDGQATLQPSAGKNTLNGIPIPHDIQHHLSHATFAALVNSESPASGHTLARFQSKVGARPATYVRGGQVSPAKQLEFSRSQIAIGGCQDQSIAAKAKAELSTPKPRLRRQIHLDETDVPWDT